MKISTKIKKHPMEPSQTRVLGNLSFTSNQTMPSPKESGSMVSALTSNLLTLVQLPGYPPKENLVQLGMVFAYR
jgi:hypothetical protein